ncbi:MAG: extracellular solute-binding protein [Thermomicrobiales bacterium]
MTDKPDFLQSRISRRSLMKGVAASGALALLAACGGTPTATPAPTARPSAAASTGGAASAAPASAAAASTGASAAPGSVTTVTWFASRDTSGFSPQQVEAINKAATTFKIDYQEQGATTQDLHDKFVTVAQAKDPSADIVSMDVPYVPEFAAAGWTIAMDSVLSKDELAKFFKGTLDGATYDKKLYAIPWYNNGPGLYVRKDLLQAKGLTAPKTYDELLKAALAVQTPEMVGFAMQLVQGEGGIINWMEYLWGYGGSLVDDNMKVAVDQGTFGVDSMQKVVDFVYKDKIIPEAALQFKLGADVINLFRTGKAAMIRLWFSNAGELYKPDTTIKPEQWEIVPLPSKDGSKAGPGCLGTWNLGVAVSSKKQQAAIEAIKVLTNEEQQKARVLGNGNLPARPAVFDDSAVQAKYPYAKSAQTAMEFLRPRPVTPFYPEISATAIQPAFGQAMAQQLKPAEAIKQMADKMRTILK